MNEHINQAVEYAFDNKVSEMQDEINSALFQKVADAISAKRIEVAQSLMNNQEVTAEEIEDLEELSKDTLKGYVNKRQWSMGSNEKEQKKLEKNLERADKKIADKETNESYIEEVLSVSDGVDKWIHDFVHSDNPKFEGKSKKERIQMALGAYYSAKKGKTRNEEVEDLEEISNADIASMIPAASALWAAGTSIPFGKSERSVADRVVDAGEDAKAKLKKVFSKKKNIKK